MTSAFRFSMAFLAILSLASLASFTDAQEPKSKGKGKKASDGPLDPWGRVEGSITDTGARYYVWYDGEKWHLRSASRKMQSFSGTVKVKDGAIRTWIPIGLDANKKKPQGNDVFTLKSRQELVFQFHTSKKSDGIDLKIEGAQGEVEFDLTINGERKPKAVFVGKNSQHPGAVPFTLPVAPPKPEKKAVEKEAAGE